MSKRTLPPHTHTSADFATKPAAVDSAEVTNDAANPPIGKEEFARHWKFASFLEMFEATTPIGNAGGKKKWLLTALRGGKWLLWNEVEPNSAQTFDSRDVAIEWLQQG